MVVANILFISYGILANKRSRWRNFIFDIFSPVTINDYPSSILAYQEYIKKYWMTSSLLAPRFVIEITEWKIIKDTEKMSRVMQIYQLSKHFQLCSRYTQRGLFVYNFRLCGNARSWPSSLLITWLAALGHLSVSKSVTRHKALLLTDHFYLSCEAYQRTQT